MAHATSVPTPPPGGRWELYRTLADPVRLRLLALASLEELAIGELAELLGEGQPKVSRHAAALRAAGLLHVRRQGSWALARLQAGVHEDPVVEDALRAGKALCEGDGTLDRVGELVRRRDAATREFFASRRRAATPEGFPAELSAYLVALGALVPARRLAVDLGTGDGGLLEVLAPVFDRVVAADRSPVQLELAAERVRRRGLDNVELVAGELDSPAVRDATLARGGADAVFAARVLHHAPRPMEAVRAMALLLRPGGRLVVLDYEPHDDERLRAEQADLWLGFPPDELVRAARDAGLVPCDARRVPRAFRGSGADRAVGWQVLSAAAPPAEAPGAARRPRPITSPSTRRTR